MREIVLDTETTGLDPADGHRIVEIACIELVNHVPSGVDFHRYVNPERQMDADALAVHGITDAMLADKPRFADIAGEFLAFLGDARVVAHNAEFDLRFLNHELRLAGLPPLACGHEDTLALARRRFPGAPASLDALCRRFAIDLSERALHGALVDCKLLAAVYLELIGGRQPTLDIVVDPGAAGSALELARPARAARPHAASADELAAHEAMLTLLKEPIWRAGA
jgi:DNA polymerase III subunit epsilon